MVQTLLLCSVLTLCCCVSAAPVGLVRDSTEGAPAEKSCRIGNGLGNIVASILHAFWGFIVNVITTLSTLRSSRLWNTASVGAKHRAVTNFCVCVHARIRFGKYGRNLDSVEFFQKMSICLIFLVRDENFPYFLRYTNVSHYTKIDSRNNEYYKLLLLSMVEFFSK
jgi:hypothetical protein